MFEWNGRYSRAKVYKEGILYKVLMNFEGPETVKEYRRICKNCHKSYGKHLGHSCPER